MNRVRNNYMIGHLTNADLSILNDFNELKESLDIVNKSFVTLGKPLIIDNVNVYIRDTMLLAPAGKKSLAALGDLIGVAKVKLEDHEINSMEVLLVENKEKFVNYALTDAMITLIYGNKMEDEMFDARCLGIPISLSSLSASYVKNKWEESGYQGYQINPKYLLGESGVLYTPKGLRATSEAGRKLGLYTANYRGGRNESYMYGVDEKTQWYDYDLIAAYPTAMAMLGNPDYKKARNLTLSKLKGMSDQDLIFNYVIITVNFKFDSKVKYPSIPCVLDENTTVYPLEGESVLTGVEYLLAKKQGCEFSNLRDGYIIPFERGEEGCLVNQPFKDIVKELQLKRNSHAKGTFSNLMEKEKTNSIYGNVVRGMSNKMKFDIKTGRTIRMEGGVLTNPVIAS